MDVADFYEFLVGEPNFKAQTPTVWKWTAPDCLYITFSYLDTTFESFCLQCVTEVVVEFGGDGGDDSTGYTATFAFKKHDDPDEQGKEEFVFKDASFEDKVGNLIVELVLTRRQSDLPQKYVAQMIAGTPTPDFQKSDKAWKFIFDTYQGLVDMTDQLFRTIEEGVWVTSPGISADALTHEILFLHTYLPRALKTTHLILTVEKETDSSGGTIHRPKIRYTDDIFTIKISKRSYKIHRTILSLLGQWLVQPQTRYFVLGVEEPEHGSVIVIDSHDNAKVFECFNTRSPPEELHAALRVALELHDPRLDTGLLAAYTPETVCPGLQWNRSTTVSAYKSFYDDDLHDGACASWWPLYVILRTADLTVDWMARPGRASTIGGRVCVHITSHIRHGFRSMYTVGTTMALIGKDLMALYEQKAATSYPNLGSHRTTRMGMNRLLYEYIFGGILTLTDKDLQDAGLPARRNGEALVSDLGNFEATRQKRQRTQ